MVGIPGHAWELRSAEALLADSCWVDSVDHVTVSRGDMASFRLTAWTPDPARIPTVNTLAVTEPDDGMRLRPPAKGRRFRSQVKALLYPVEIRSEVVEPSLEPSPDRPIDDFRWNNGDSGRNGRPSDSDGSDGFGSAPLPPPPPPAGSGRGLAAGNRGLERRDRRFRAGGGRRHAGAAPVYRPVVRPGALPPAPPVAVAQHAAPSSQPVAPSPPRSELELPALPSPAAAPASPGRWAPRRSPSPPPHCRGCGAA